MKICTNVPANVPAQHSAHCPHLPARIFFPRVPDLSLQSPYELTRKGATEHLIQRGPRRVHRAARAPSVTPTAPSPFERRSVVSLFIGRVRPFFPCRDNRVMTQHKSLVMSALSFRGATIDRTWQLLQHSFWGLEPSPGAAAPSSYPPPFRPYGEQSRMHLVWVVWVPRVCTG